MMIAKPLPILSQRPLKVQARTVGANEKESTV